MTRTNCPTCGSRVIQHNSEEGTGCYLPDDDLEQQARQHAEAKRSLPIHALMADFARKLLKEWNTKIERYEKALQEIIRWEEALDENESAIVKIAREALAKEK